MTPARRTLIASLCLLLAGALLGVAPWASARPVAERTTPMWTTTVFARVPSPGHPAYVHVARSGRVYAGTYDAGTSTPSRVFEWTRSGTLLRSFTVPHQSRRGGTQGVQVAGETRDGRLVVLETSRRAVLLLNVESGRFHRIATLPKGSIPNYATWGPRGLYVTDYGLGVIWRIDRAGRRHRWFASPALEGVAGFGTTGIRYRPGSRDFLISQQSAGDGAALPTNGHLYRLTTRAHGRPGRVSTLWTSQPADLPDGFGIGRSGHVYVAMSGLTNRLVELSRSGRELDSFPGVPGTGENGSPIPFDTPCSATFLGRSVLVANQSAIQGDATHMAILKVAVSERGRAPYLPRRATFR